MFHTANAGSLPKPAWLAQAQKLWPRCKRDGDELAHARLDATPLRIKAPKAPARQRQVSA